MFLYRPCQERPQNDLRMLSGGLFCSYGTTPNSQQETPNNQVNDNGAACSLRSCLRFRLFSRFGLFQFGRLVALVALLVGGECLSFLGGLAEFVGAR